jgi:transcriptional regulator with XRE-family HTH domain
MLTEVLRKLLDERGISIAEVARRTGVPKSNIHAWLQGASPSVGQLDRVARYFGVSMEYLAFGREAQDLFSKFFDQFEVHRGEYEISVRKIGKKKF